MRNFLAFVFFFLLSCVSHAQEASSAQPSVVPSYQEPFSAQALLQLVLGLALVVVLILVIAWLLRRFSGIAPVSKNMRVLGVMPLGTREKVVLVQVGEKQMLLGVAPGRVSHLESFEKPVVEISESDNKGFAARLGEAMKKQQVDKGNE